MTPTVPHQEVSLGLQAVKLPIVAPPFCVSSVPNLQVCSFNKFMFTSEALSLGTAEWGGRKPITYNLSVLPFSSFCSMNSNFPLLSSDRRTFRIQSGAGELTTEPSSCVQNFFQNGKTKTFYPSERHLSLEVNNLRWAQEVPETTRFTRLFHLPASSLILLSVIFILQLMPTQWMNYFRCHYFGLNFLSSCFARVSVSLLRISVFFH